ncbi:type II toxin-antitoxin system death-on-curing family toxin [Halalkalibacillus sediminis]|uniref:Type II toxin-antitoxin system death-on-curing family toxin n=1 Tax=Halalkalibacillus sediminis TaxID=2018042 RepID=A0A2I0QSN5_9BACI|nr:type II toxin-antitoxin system death-on-curing family toxin [Halalkalibacillus sediminis]PKR77120.1 type II toxin-antitoxin system death-on-curing family toxin [Halalkalibacillus sediminis]
MKNIRYLTEEEVITLNVYLIEIYSSEEISGVKDASLLQSAVNRPLQSAFGEDAYPTIEEKAAALFESLAKNHPFHNANKRTAFMAMLQFLSYNNRDFNMEQKKAEDFVVDVVTHKVTFEEIINIIKAHQ